MSTLLAEAPIALVVVSFSGVLSRVKLGHAFQFSWDNICSLGAIALVSCVALCGLGLVLGAATMLWHQVSGWRGVIQYAFLFFSGIFGELSDIRVLHLVPQIIPLTWTVRTLQLVVVRKYGFWELLSSLEFLILMAAAFLSLCGGVVMFVRAEKLTRKSGTAHHF